MNDFLDNLYGVLFRPNETFKKITREQKIGQGLVVLILSSVFPLMAAFQRPNFRFSYSLPPEIPWQIRHILPRMGPYFLLIGIVAVILFRPAMMFVYTGVLHLLSGFMGGRGSGKGLYAGLCYSTLPLVFGAPVTFISRLSRTGFINAPLYFMFFIWMVLLQITSIKQNNDFPTITAAIVFFLPLLFLIGVMILMMIFVFAGAMPFIIPYIR